MPFPCSLNAALANSDDMLLELGNSQSRDLFLAYLGSHAREIEHLVSHHLRLAPARDNCTISDRCEWMGGNFNVCIPVHINSGIQSHGSKVLLRVALPFKLGEANMPGNVEEKLRCESATYIWLHQHCPSVKIPRLWGCGFPSGSRVCMSSIELYPMRVFALVTD